MAGALAFLPHCVPEQLLLFLKSVLHCEASSKFSLKKKKKRWGVLFKKKRKNLKTSNIIERY